jgi:SAM-dependent methyltransferase
MQRRMTDYLDHRFDDWAAIDADYDELPLWSAPFGQLLLEHVPLRRGMRVLDLAFGTGFPLLELASRLGATGFAVGVDPWRAALLRASSKQRAHRIANAAAVIGDAATLPLGNGSIDLIVSDLGVNNLADPDAALAECTRREAGRRAGAQHQPAQTRARGSARVGARKGLEVPLNGAPSPRAFRARWAA